MREDAVDDVCVIVDAQLLGHRQQQRVRFGDRLAAPIALLESWDHRWSATSQPTTPAVFWGDTLWREVGSFAQAERMNVPDYILKRTTAATQLAALNAAVTG